MSRVPHLVRPSLAYQAHSHRAAKASKISPRLGSTVRMAYLSAHPSKAIFADNKGLMKV